MNAWYDRINGAPPPVQYSGGVQFANPMQKMNYIMQAMTNPAAFIRQQFPDIPEEVLNGGPNQVGNYLQSRLGAPNPQLQQLIRANPYPPMRR